MAKKENKMNAKEFAHELEKAASFIRQQQAEIEALKSHPAELTDEEIMQIVWQQNILLGNDALKKFARAILRKAQEK